MTRLQLFSFWALAAALAMLAVILEGCGATPARSTVPVAVVSPTNVELDDVAYACDHAPTHRSRARHSPLRTAHGAVWCF